MEYLIPFQVVRDCFLVQLERCEPRSVGR